MNLNCIECRYFQDVEKFRDVANECTELAQNLVVMEKESRRLSRYAVNVSAVALVLSIASLSLSITSLFF